MVLELCFIAMEIDIKESGKPELKKAKERWNFTMEMCMKVVFNSITSMAEELIDTVMGISMMGISKKVYKMVQESTDG